MNLQEYDISNPRRAVVRRSERITPLTTEVEVRHIELEVPAAGFDFVEGQSIGVLAPGAKEFGNAHHLRLYSIASSRAGEKGNSTVISICVRRCFYIDPVNGERHPGIASNFLCDALPGDAIQITGPYGQHFTVPRDDTCNLLMIGVGTGIAPFRAFVKHIFEDRKGWRGKVRLFYGARSGMESLYLNDLKRDVALYYDKETFQAFQAVSPRPHLDTPADLDRLLVENAMEVWNLINDPKTYVYIAGLEQALHAFDKAMAIIAHSEENWRRKREELAKEGRLAELLY
jgi:ferredoxin--NADP+ reductase